MKVNTITLTKTEEEDLTTLFEFQLNEDANYLAAFTGKDPHNKPAYIEKYSKHLADPTINNQTIYADGVIVGSIAKFIMHNDAEITYWIDHAWWGKGVATAALLSFLKIEQTRPLYARTAFDNYGSQRVLEKCGFQKIGTDSGYANARKTEIEEYIYQLTS
ncbi:MAG: N-acetyltransferase [Chitinophagaceae bacterium]|nr:MAG: N-acetyltransferase [Chitinophagaceae bacterium]